MKNILKKNNQKGSLMVEALALLGLITMVTPILYKKAAERTTELQDINVATQMRMISSAVDDFLKDNYKEVGERYPNDVFSLTEADRETLEKYLPKGFDLTQSRLFNEFQIQIRRQEVEDRKGNMHNIYTSAVLAPTTEDLTRMRAAKIASMIGSSGGVYRGGMLQGVQGSWTADAVEDYGFTVDGVRDESLAVISTKAISSAKGDVSSDDVLFRIDTGDEGDNTMQAALLMDGNEIRGLTNLIASSTGGSGAAANEIVIGRKNGDIVQQIADLFVTGKVNIKESLTVDGETTLNNGLTVTAGDTNLQNTNIAGNLNVDGETTLKNTSIDGTLSVSGDTNLHNTNIDGNLNVSGDTTLNNLNVSGDTTLNNLTVNGPATFNENVTMNKDLTVAGDALFEGDVTIENDLYVDGDIIVPDNKGVMGDWLYAKSGIKVGGKNADGKTSPGNYFTVDSTGTNVKSGTFNVRDKLYVNNSRLSYGGEADTEGNKINVSAAGNAFLGYSYAIAGMDRKGFYSTATTNYITMNGGANKPRTVFSQSGSSGLTSIVGYDSNNLERYEIRGYGATGSIKLTANKVKDNTAQVGSQLYLMTTSAKLKSSNLVFDDKGLALYDGTQDINADGGFASVKPIDSSNTTGSILQTGAKVAIGRQGIVEVASPTAADNNGGYFKGRRLVSDKNTYPTDNAFHGYDYDGSTAATKKYDYYQVNPAYTSVMNDIKLATRGGARLSDILPDYINKGIYVVDNTYKNSAVSQWEGKWLGSPAECKSGDAIDNTCIASPWMGYVPAPQCPKNYAKVITLNPIRWRMSEVYTIFDTANWPVAQAAYRTLIGGDDFKKYFIQPTDPRHAEFKLSDGGGEAHTHTPQEGRPMTFQTNTWLNTTVSPLYGGTDCHGKSDVTNCPTTGDPVDFIGWHAIMGFIYRPTQYNTLLKELGAENVDANTSVYWNLFPVYAGDMAAVANVYCYFERNTATAGTSWRWGDPVYKYDQLNAYKQGFTKDANWSSAVNDPELGYTDAW